MPECYLTFSTMTAAQRAARLLRADGIPVRLVRTPPPIAVRGCGASLLVAEESLEDARSQLVQLRAAPRGAFCRTGSGGFRAVAP